MKNTIYFGDNLDILKRYIKDESVDLIYLDPPFNSKKAYNVIYGKDVQAEAFKDTWTWSGDIPKTYDDIINKCNNNEVINAIESFKIMLGQNNTMAYLVMMTPRLMELHRVLKDTGSIYLHCDPTASHYLKIIMDNIFGIENFRNEIVWYYTKMGNATKNWLQNHDTLLFYSKDDEYKFNPQYDCTTTSALRERLEKYIDSDNVLRYGSIKNIRQQLLDSYISSAKNRLGKKSLDDDDIVIDFRESEKSFKKVDNVWYIPFLKGNSKEYVGYPTQKPLALLDRIIKASSNEGDIVLDPFCGCATTMVSAQKLGRKWIGIDITYQSVRLLKRRLKDVWMDLQYKKDNSPSQMFDIEYDVEGEPKTVEQAYNLIEERGRFRFQEWIVVKIGGIPNTTKTADKGMEGFYYWGTGKHKKAIISVKSGHVAPTDIRDLRGTMDRNKADAGIFLTLKEPTKGMIDEAVSNGFIHDQWENKHPKLQIVTVKQILDGELPSFREFF